jgi:hypothetical protein
MNILVLHRVPYFKIEYHRGIDHDAHDVTYFGTRAALDTLPADLRCRRVERPGVRTPEEEARAWIGSASVRFDRVISMSEYELLDAARLREWLGIEGAPTHQVMLSRDKVRMKAAAARAGVRTPRFLPLTEFVASGGRAPWTGPTVLKPHLGASSVDVVVFPDAEQAYKSVVAGSSGVTGLDTGTPDLAGFEVEEFVDGPILHFDGLVERGGLLTVGASEYVGTCLGYARGEPMGSVQIECTDTMRSWVARSLEAVEIHNGSFHLEAIMDGAEPVFLEVGNRVGGADVVATFELSTGIHLPTWELKILLGEPGAGSLPARPAGDRSWFGWFVFPGHHVHPGAYAGFDGIEPFRGSPEVITWAELELGAAFPDHITYGAGETALTGVIGTPSPEHSRDWMTRLFRRARMRTTTPAIP